MKEETKIIHEDPYELVAQAIIKHAMSDYKTALRRDNFGQIAALEKFFRSGYGELLSFGHGEEIIQFCGREVEEEPAEIPRKKKTVRWRWDSGVYVPFCPYCDELAYEHDKCAFCGEEYQWISGDYKPTQVIVGEYIVCQGISKGIYLYKGADLVMHSTSTRTLTKKELIDQVDFYENLIRERRQKSGGK